MELNAKRSVLDDGVFVLRKLKGRVVLRIDGISEYLTVPTDTDEYSSDRVHIRGFDWFIIGSRYSDPDNCFQFYIDCHSSDSRANPDWNCAASVILLCTSGGKEVEIGREDDVKCGDNLPDSGWICEVSILQISVTMLIILSIYF